jgi:hypothetical protein
MVEMKVALKVEMKVETAVMSVDKMA